MPDMTQAVPGLLAQVHPAHTHSHDIMAYVTELEYRVSLWNRPS
jgi:quercetin dioxygenase-like cupin family protein